MSSSGSQLRSIISINSTLFYAASFGALAWFSWPQTAANWQLGVFSIICASAAIGLSVKGFGEIGRQIKVKEFNDQGRKPKSDQLASEKELRKAGMIE